MSDKPKTSRVKLKESVVLSDDWATLTRHTFEYERRDGQRETQQREVYDRGDATAVIPYDIQRKTVLLVRQLRLPIFLNEGVEGLIEACAGVREHGEDPVTCIEREALEELGYRLRDTQFVARAYSSPGSVNECVWCYTAHYSPEDRANAGGGAADEGEDIEVLELPLEEAVSMIATGAIMDMKTIIILQHLDQTLAGRS